MMQLVFTRMQDRGIRYNSFMLRRAIVCLFCVAYGSTFAEIVDLRVSGRPQQNQTEAAFELREFLGIDLVTYKPRTLHDDFETIQLKKKFRTFDRVGIKLNTDRSRPIAIDLRSSFCGVKYEDVYKEAHNLADVFSKAYGIRFLTMDPERGRYVFENQNVKFWISVYHDDGPASLFCFISLKKNYYSKRLVMNADEGLDQLSGCLDKVPVKTNAEIRCSAIYNDGKQCRRMTDNGGGYCSAHIHYDKQNPPFRLDEEAPVNDEEKEIVTKRKLKRIESLLIKYSKKHGGKYPASWSSFCVAMPTLDYPPQKDGWGGSFRYEQYGEFWIVAAPGKDRKIGTDDDFVVTNYKEETK